MGWLIVCTGYFSRIPLLWYTWVHSCIHLSTLELSSVLFQLTIGATTSPDDQLCGSWHQSMKWAKCTLGGAFHLERWLVFHFYLKSKGLWCCWYWNENGHFNWELFILWFCLHKQRYWLSFFKHIEFRYIILFFISFSFFHVGMKLVSGKNMFSLMRNAFLLQYTRETEHRKIFQDKKMPDNTEWWYLSCISSLSLLWGNATETLVLEGNHASGMGKQESKMNSLVDETVNVNVLESILSNTVSTHLLMITM